MAAPRPRLPRVLLLASLAATAACASAGDRLDEGIELQARGRYVEAVYRYAEALEKDRTLVEARERLLIAGDSALMTGMDEADALERRGDPVAAAARYRALDRMLARIRSVRLRLEPPSGYDELRRGVLDRAVEWLMAEGHEAREEGRWADAPGR